MAEVEFHLHNEVGIKFPPLRPAYSDGEMYFGRFRELVARSTGTSIIGEGGTGRIHLVRDELMEREVALKIPLDSVLRDPAAREDVIRETRQAMDLTHPNIVRIHDFHEGDRKWGISMQYVRGKNLDEWRYDSESTGFRRVIRPYTVEAIRDWVAQLCDALRYAHEDARMVHRDIKPKNLMLEKREGGEKVFITDFGISQRLRLHTLTLSRDQTKAGESKGNMGTLPYMPWEQIVGAPASHLDDVYAVGATIYELITGRPPFYDGGFEQLKVQIREVPPPRMEQRILDLGLHLPPPPDEWEEVVAACLAKRPEDRPQSMRALAAALGFQSGSNTELEVRLSSQSERIYELETQIISLSHATGPVMNPETEEALATARRDLEERTRQAEQAQNEVERLAAAVTAATQQAEEAQSEVRNLAAAVTAAHQAERDLEEKLVAAKAELAATKAERDTVLEGGDQAVRKLQEESAKRIAKAEERVSALQAEVAAAKAAGESLAAQARQLAQQRIAELEGKVQTVGKDAEQQLQKVRKESEGAVQRAQQEAAKAAQAATEKLRRELEQATERSRQAEAGAAVAVQQAKQEADKATQMATEKLRRELDQATERSRKAEEEQKKAVALVREEAGKRLQKQAEELEKSRQSVTKLEEQNKRKERELAIEKERQGASLKPVLVSLLIAMVLGLGGGLVGPKLWGGSSKIDFAGQDIPKGVGVAAEPVTSALFRKYAESLGVKASVLDKATAATKRITSGPLEGVFLKDGKVYGVTGLTALNFCHWLTKMAGDKDQKEKPLPSTQHHYTLPALTELESLERLAQEGKTTKIEKGAMEWSRDSAKPGQVLTMRGYYADQEDLKNYDVHVIQSRQEFTFRVALKPITDPEQSKADASSGDSPPSSPK
jgi:serine/threonine protein kinase